MPIYVRCFIIAVIGVFVLGPVPAVAQLMSTCVEKPPVRRREFGCRILQTKVLPKGLRQPVFWHIDRFDTGMAARAAVRGRS
jgi:hypothetical protein